MWLSWQHQIPQDWLISKVGKGGEQSQVSLAGIFWGMGAWLGTSAFFPSPQLWTEGLSRVVWHKGGWLAQGTHSGL